MSYKYANVYAQISIQQFKEAAKQFLADKNMSRKYWHDDDVDIFLQLADKLKDLLYPPVNKSTRDVAQSHDSNELNDCRDMASLVFNPKGFDEAEEIPREFKTE